MVAMAAVAAGAAVEREAAGLVVAAREAVDLAAARVAGLVVVVSEEDLAAGLVESEGEEAEAARLAAWEGPGVAAVAVGLAEETEGVDLEAAMEAAG